MKLYDKFTGGATRVFEDEQFCLKSYNSIAVELMGWSNLNLYSLNSKCKRSITLVRLNPNCDNHLVPGHLRRPPISSNQP